jgi:hypothetical protein
MSIILANIEFPTWPPTWERDMLLKLKLWSQANQLYFAGHTIIEQDLRAPAASEISNMNI